VRETGRQHQPQPAPAQPMAGHRSRFRQFRQPSSAPSQRLLFRFDPIRRRNAGSGPFAISTRRLRARPAARVRNVHEASRPTPSVTRTATAVRQPRASPG
jgi:hypothetical protein